MKTQSGITLVEALVASVVGALVLAGAYRAFRGFHKDSLRQQAVISAQSELLPMQKLIEKDIRRASHGIPPVSFVRDSLGRTQAYYAVEVTKQARGVSALVVRGNFSGVSSQLRMDGAKATAWLELMAGTARGFVAGDMLLLEAGDANEVASLLEVDTVGSRLRVQTRSQDFPAGTSVIRISSATYSVVNGKKLVYRNENGRIDTLSTHMDLLQVTLRTLDGGLDSMPPLDLARGRGIVYGLAVKWKKPGAADSLSRTVNGEVTLRNLML